VENFIIIIVRFTAARRLQKKRNIEQWDNKASIKIRKMAEKNQR